MFASMIVIFLILRTVSLTWESPIADYRLRANAIEFPYIVLLRIYAYKEEFICTGSLIHPQWVLTAAHCTTNSKFIQVYAAVPFAENRSANTSKERLAKKVITYPGFINILAFHGRNANKDYSLIKLESSFDVDHINIGLIPLENATWTNDKRSNCFSAGYGSMYGEETLFVFSVTANYRACPCKRKKYLMDRYICSTAGENYKPSLCPGDSGGPLICNNKQVGVASHTYPINGCDLFSTRSSVDYGCEVPGTVSTYTYVCPVLSWIRKYVGDSIPIQPTHC